MATANKNKCFFAHEVQPLFESGLYSTESVDQHMDNSTLGVSILRYIYDALFLDTLCERLELHSNN